MQNSSNRSVTACFAFKDAVNSKKLFFNESLTLNGFSFFIKEESECIKFELILNKSLVKVELVKAAEMSKRPFQSFLQSITIFKITAPSNDKSL